MGMIHKTDPGYISDLEHENVCLNEMYDDMRALLLRTQKLLDCGLLFVHYTQRLEAASIIEEIDKLLPPAKEVKPNER
jgi:hypothetical protein